MARWGCLTPPETARKYHLLLADTCIRQQKWKEAEQHLLSMDNLYGWAPAMLAWAILKEASGIPFSFILLRWTEKDFSDEKVPWFRLLYSKILSGLSPLRAQVMFSQACRDLAVQNSYLEKIFLFSPGPTFFPPAPPGTGFPDTGYSDPRTDFPNDPPWLLLKMLMETKGKHSAVDTVCQILSLPGPLHYQDLALEWLIQDPRFWEEPAAFNKLQEIFEKEGPLREKFWLIKGQFYLQNDRSETALQFLEDKRSQFSTPSLKSKALFLLAYSALLKTPPSYSEAADRLEESQRTFPEGWPDGSLTGMRADCLFLNGDYETASELYHGALETNSSSLQKSEWAYQWVLSGVLQKDLEDAKRRWREAIQKGWLKGEEKWEAGIVLLEGMIKTRHPNTLENIDLLEASFPERKRKLSHLRAEWHLLNDHPQEALGELRYFPPENVREFWLNGRVLEQTGDYVQASQAFRSLREHDSGRSQWTLLSYAEEAKCQAMQKNYVRAQQLWTEAADQFPDHPYAPTALYLAADNARQRGLKYAPDTVALLNRLIKHYPTHELVYFAKLKEGHLLMSLNHFAAAKQIFASLPHDHPAHVQNPYGKFLELKCEMALATGHAENEVRSLETLLSYPELPNELRLEMAYMLSELYVSQERYSEAKRRLWSLVDPLLQEPVASHPKEAYWLSRC
ncbi:MAG: tetratricopeptide repeat protein, partial [Puniceicoccales bacterium]|nr:tetratricopeptide repeat protein [Puniceicoccales bacterium]